MLQEHKNKGKKQTAEHIAKRVAKQIGKKHTLEARKKMSESRKLFYVNGGKHPRLGKTHSDEVRKKLSEIAKKQWENGQFGRGKESQSWKGGVTPIREAMRKCKEYRLWKIAVFTRDDKTCIWCGSKKNIEADHIKPFCLYPELRFSIDNGRTLCRDCHKKTSTYGNVNY